MKKIIERIIIIFFFLAVLAFPYIAYLFGVENNLQGADEKVELSFSTLDDYIIQNFPGREILVRSKNQFLYSFFDVSPNSSISKIGDNLISTETLDYYYHGTHEVEPKDVDILIEKFETLAEIYKEKNKKMFIIVTPTKARYYDGRLPFADDIVLAYEKKRHYNPYDILKEKLSKSNLNYFDSIDYIEKHKDVMLGGEVPLFYKSGHHWSNFKGNLVGIGLAEFIEKNIGITMPKLRVIASPSDAAIYPDSDLFDVLNIYDKPNEKFYSSEVEFVEYNVINHNYLIQGGSFLGGLLLPCLTLGTTNMTVHIENKACIYDKYSKTITFDDYDDLDKKINLLKQLSSFDVVIFEINELNVYNATFGFLDYLLSHKEMI